MGTSMKPVVPAADAQLGVGAGGKQAGVPHNGMWIVSLVCAEAQHRGDEDSEPPLRVGVVPVCGMTVCSVACSE